VRSSISGAGAPGAAFATALRPTWTSPGRVGGPAWPCTGWGLPSRRVTAALVRSYRTISTLPVRGSRVAAPSAVSFLWHFPAGFPGWALPTTLALRCPDFPRGIHLPRDRMARKPNDTCGRAERQGTQVRREPQEEQPSTAVSGPPQTGHSTGWPAASAAQVVNTTSSSRRRSPARAGTLPSRAAPFAGEAAAPRAPKSGSVRGVPPRRRRPSCVVAA
jgi:hypothetical protein